MNSSIQTASGEETLPLFRAYPHLAQTLPRVALGNFPTPIHKLDQIGKTIGLHSLYIKRDDLSSDIYGGNKIRNLEFLLGDVLRSRAKEVVAIGFAGSNHAVATAIHANRLGLRTASLLLPQVNAHYVRHNLLAGYSAKAELIPVSNLLFLPFALIAKLLKAKMKLGRFPKIIPPGGSSPLGVAGYVSAAFELKEQILAGEMPEPDRIYLAMGSMGTATGLILGLKVAGIKSEVIAVRVIGNLFANTRRMARLFNATSSLLHKSDPAFPKVIIGPAQINIRDDCLGDGYARFTEKAVKAAALMEKSTGIRLNGAYSAKGFSALLDDAERQILNGQTVLFWNTFNSRELSAKTAQVDYRQLPEPLHRYFEEEVQPLDNPLIK